MRSTTHLSPCIFPTITNFSLIWPPYGHLAGKDTLHQPRCILADPKTLTNFAFTSLAQKWNIILVNVLGCTWNTTIIQTSWMPESLVAALLCQKSKACCKLLAILISTWLYRVWVRNQFTKSWIFKLSSKTIIWSKHAMRKEPDTICYDLLSLYVRVREDHGDGNFEMCESYANTPQKKIATRQVKQRKSDWLMYDTLRAHTTHIYLNRTPLYDELVLLNNKKSLCEDYSWPPNVISVR